MMQLVSFEAKVEYVLYRETVSVESSQICATC